jgi:hypothetical protein
MDVEVGDPRLGFDRWLDGRMPHSGILPYPTDITVSATLTRISTQPIQAEMPGSFSRARS